MKNIIAINKDIPMFKIVLRALLCSLVAIILCTYYVAGNEAPYEKIPSIQLASLESDV
ncbi:MAG: hypothetical protein IJ712_02485 [Anaerovibrio sp.]|uniref:hypothetical protein n=1 Tax=Anaerovibrio sp. TaxID=1872532 RepID=UPI0025B9479B|nr:hypothetical protein [Anaerovibrio sp.]MBR1697075.1 hypothetical protein [Anaerovibrio sp.]MBR2141972.1 hypothetical protein [Anaerovibrio sp.]